MIYIQRFALMMLSLVQGNSASEQCDLLIGARL